MSDGHYPPLYQYLFKNSYGGHYGPAFYQYFYSQNQLIESGYTPGVKLQMGKLVFCKNLGNCT